MFANEGDTLQEVLMKDERTKEILAAIDGLQSALDRLKAATAVEGNDDMGRLLSLLTHKLLKHSKGSRVSVAALRGAYARLMRSDERLRSIAMGCGYVHTNRDPVWRAFRLVAMDRADRVVNVANRLFLDGLDINN